MPPAFVLSQDQTLKLTGRCRPKPASKSESQITSACLAPFLVPDAPAFDVSNSARRRLRIPSVFTISKSDLPRGRPCAGTKEATGWTPFLHRSVLRRRRLIAPGHQAVKPNLHFFCSCHQRDGGAGRKGGRTASAARSAVWKTIETEGSKDVPARCTAFGTSG